MENILPLLKKHQKKNQCIPYETIKIIAKHTKTPIKQLANISSNDIFYYENNQMKSQIPNLKSQISNCRSFGSKNKTRTSL